MELLPRPPSSDSSVRPRHIPETRGGWRDRPLCGHGETVRRGQGQRAAAQVPPGSRHERSSWPLAWAGTLRRALRFVDSWSAGGRQADSLADFVAAIAPFGLAFALRRLPASVSGRSGTCKFLFNTLPEPLRSVFAGGRRHSRRSGGRRLDVAPPALHLPRTRRGPVLRLRPRHGKRRPRMRRSRRAGGADPRTVLAISAWWR